MKIISIYLLIILIATQVLADNQITRKNLKFDTSNDYTERLDGLEKENQHLLGRIEIIEHTIDKLEKILNSTKQEVTNSQDSSDTSKNSVDDSVANDVFDIPSTKKVEKEVVATDVVKPISGVAPDKQLYDLALAALKDNKLTEAEEKFANFLKNYSKSPLLSNAYFWYGESFFRRKMFDKAAINYLKGYKQSPKGIKASDSLLKLALSLGELKKGQEACSILDKLEAEFPNRPATSIKRAKEARIKFACKH
ncbi:tol-pal system protein YbgF [Rickettsia endosymbiont of Oedothorax gibbosus]|uniref:tol-pal system protein YbgF n=1 Tax=Rickettsia endosymbiont of Oedothorax gibbosus TaxID=931099 RepID=UPI00202591B5|nr:tol-pal system protein YbgF [Rickettsia endosymbiont of Oedothorax gibbosus]